MTALLALHYPNLEVVVINDGSPVGTLGALTERFGLQPIHPIVWKRIETKPVRELYRSRSHPNVLYRQLTTVWRLRGIWKFLRGRTDWGKMERRGLPSQRSFAMSALRLRSMPVR